MVRRELENLLKNLNIKKPDDDDELTEGSKPDGPKPCCHRPSPHDPAKVSSDNEDTKPDDEENDMTPSLTMMTTTPSPSRHPILTRALAQALAQA